MNVNYNFYCQLLHFFIFQSQFVPLSFGLEATFPSAQYTFFILSIKSVVIMYAWDIINQHIIGVWGQNVTQKLMRG